MTIDNTIIELLQARDGQAQKEFYKGFYPAMFNLCRGFLGDYHDAQEAVNDGLLSIFNKIEGFEYRDPGSFVGWVKTVMINACKMRARAGERRWVLWG